MSRTTQLKILYVLLLLALGGVVYWVLIALDSTLAMAGLVLVLLVPGRVCGHYWRDFFKGRNLMTHGMFEEAEPFFETFLATLKQKPWLKRLILLSWGIYTRDIEVMTLNNLGAVKIEQGEWLKGKDFLDRAIAMDPQAPLPYYNLALIAVAEGKKDSALELYRMAKERGFTGSSIDDLIRQGSELLARIEGTIDG